MSSPALQNADTELNTDTHMPCRVPKTGMNAGMYSRAPIISAISVPRTTRERKPRSPEMLSKFSASRSASLELRENLL